MIGPGTILPAGGTMAEAVAYASGRRPDMICGKPNEALARHLLASRKFDPATTCMVGDRNDTDIEFGLSAGMQTLFVESGTMTEVEARNAPPGRVPHFLADSIS